MRVHHWLMVGLVATSAIVYTGNVSAQDIQIRYSTLYGKLKQNVKEGHDDVKMAFFLLNQKDGSVCKVHRGWMQKDEHYEALVIPSSYELDVPVDKNLRQANPDVTFVIDDGITCDMSMQVIAKDHFSTTMTQADVTRLVPQMQSLLSDLGGMFSDWFMPEVSGVVVHLAEQPLDFVPLANGQRIPVNEKKAVIKLSDLAIDEQITFPSKIVKVTPWLPRD